MKAVNITFKHGHIYDSDSKQRLIIREDVNYILIFDKQSDIEIGKFEASAPLKTGSEIINSLKQSGSVTHIKKIADKGSFFYFFISESDENDADSDDNSIIWHTKKQAWFRIKLLEDLFLYSSSDFKNKELRDKGKLTSCACVVDKSEDNELPFFEEVHAKSLTSVVKKTHIHYFGNLGSPAKNAFDSVYFSKDKSKHNLLEVKRGFSNLDKV